MSPRVQFVVLFSLVSTCGIAAVRADENSANDATTAETAPERYVLAYQMQAGEDLRWQTMHRATIRTTIRGTTQTAQTSTDSFKRWHVTSVSPEGDITFVHFVDQVKMVNKISERAEVCYDSAKDAQPPAGYENVAAAVGVPLAEVQIDRHGAVLKRIQKLVQPQGNFEVPIAIPLPTEPVAVGATWDEPHQITVQLADKRKKQINVRRQFELMKVDSGIAHIAVRFQVLDPLVDPSIEAQIIQHSSQGEVRFDIEHGRVLGQSIAVDKRVLGFSGPASSMHYLMKLDESAVDASALARREGEAAK
ncbi:MAG: hypothetical protein KDA42_00320 [Planctomycetales bacterium]|nr:hypothetical protein [Planctomycetales bacterium]